MSTSQNNGGCCGGHKNHGHQGKGTGLNKSFMIFFIFLGIIGFFLIIEHRAHLFGVLPYLLLLLCPLMHFVHGHGEHKHKEDKHE